MPKLIVRKVWVLTTPEGEEHPLRTDREVTAGFREAFDEQNQIRDGYDLQQRDLVEFNP